MPEYLSIETYGHYPEETLSPFLNSSRQLLENLGYTGKEVEAWLAQIVWEPDGSGFGSSFEPGVSLEKVVVNGHPLLAKPIVNGWTQVSIPQLQEAWVSLTLAFETQTERQNLDNMSSFSVNYVQGHRYQPGVGKAVWSIMRQCSDLFPQTLVYFTNEAQADESWNALLASQEKIWEFEAAIIPYSLAPRFTAVPSEFVRTRLPEGMGFARATCWSTLPWEE